MADQSSMASSKGVRTTGRSASLRTRARKARQTVSQLTTPPQRQQFPGTDKREREAAEGLFNHQPPKRSCLEPVGIDSLDKKQAHDAAKYLNVLTRLPPLDTLINEARQPLLPARPANAPNKKTLVLDMDHTMVHCTECCFDDYCRARRNREGYVTNGDSTYMFSKRPHLEYFLDRVSQVYEVVVFTAGARAYAEPLLDLLDPTRTIFTHRLYRDSCLRVFNGGTSALLVKDLSALGRDLASTFIVDDTHTVFSYQLDNGIPVSSWEGDMNDMELLRLVPLMHELEEAPDVRPVIASKFPLHKVVHGAMNEAPERFKCTAGAPPAAYRNGTNGGTPSSRGDVAGDLTASLRASMCDTGDLDLLAAMASGGFDACDDITITVNDDDDDDVDDDDVSSFHRADVTMSCVVDEAASQASSQEPEVSEEDWDTACTMEMLVLGELTPELSSTPRLPVPTHAADPEPSTPNISSPAVAELCTPLINADPSPGEVSLLLSFSGEFPSQPVSPCVTPVTSPAIAPSEDGHDPPPAPSTSSVPLPQSEEGPAPLLATLREEQVSAPLASTQQEAASCEAERDCFITPPPSPRPSPRAPAPVDVVPPATRDQCEASKADDLTTAASVDAVQPILHDLCEGSNVQDPSAGPDAFTAVGLRQEGGAAGPDHSSPAGLAVLLHSVLQEVGHLPPCAGLAVLDRLKDHTIGSPISKYLMHAGLFV